MRHREVIAIEMDEGDSAESKSREEPPPGERTAATDAEVVSPQDPNDLVNGGAAIGRGPKGFFQDAV